MFQQQKVYAGIDLHRKHSTITLMDEKGYQQSAIKIDNRDTEKFVKVLSQPNKLTKAAVESTYGWYWLADLIDSIQGVDLFLGHSLRIKALSSGKKKTDKIDSKLLADLLRCNLLPESHKTSKQNRNLKDILRHRIFLVGQRSDIKRRLHAMLAKMNLHLHFSDILGKKSRLWLKGNVTEYPYRIELETSLGLADNLNKQIEIMDKQLREEASKHPDIDLITSVPGIGIVAGLTILCEIDDINRFPNHRKLCSYAGLVPSTKSSGNKTFQGPTSQGNKYIRAMLAECIYHTLKKDTFLRNKYEEIKARKNANKAKVAVMRKLMTSIYFILSKRQPYQIRSIDTK